MSVPLESGSGSGTGGGGGGKDTFCENESYTYIRNAALSFNPSVSLSYNRRCPLLSWV